MISMHWNILDQEHQDIEVKAYLEFLGQVMSSKTYDKVGENFGCGLLVLGFWDS